MKITTMIFIAVCLSTLAASADFHVLAVGDTGKGNEDQFRVGRSMAAECKRVSCSFALLLGDNIYDVGIDSPTDPQMVDKFEKPYADMPVPFYVALGNHDYGKRADEWQKGDFQIQYSQLNPMFKLPSHYYSFEHENTLFIVLDTSRLFHDKDTKKQTDFVKETLAKNTKKWVVAIGHHPYISNGKHGNAGSYDGVPFPPYSGSKVKELVEKVLCPQVDLFVSGHDHSLQTLLGTKACSKTLFVVSGGGATVRDDLKGENPVHFQKAILGFTDLKFTDQEIIVSHLNADGGTENVFHQPKMQHQFKFLQTWFKKFIVK